MKLIKLLIFLIIIIALAFSFVPLDIYYDKIAKNIKPITLQNINGSAIKGDAEHVKYMGMDLGPAKWLAYPSSYNEVTVDFKLRGQEYDFSGKYKTKPKTELIKDLTGTVNWAMIADKINFKQGEFSGYFQFDFQHLEMSDGVPESIIGTIISQDFKLIKPINKDLGQIEIVFTSENPSIIVGQVNSKSNVLNVSGAIYIHKNHRWEVKLNLIPMPGEYEIEYALQGFGDRRRGGGRSFNLAGFY
ncbi:MAG: type II secretion system protein N [Proteobacteria bacterium]|nr:type II secretion system protein N [Pseudomonadota bacterium]